MTKFRKGCEGANRAVPLLNTNVLRLLAPRNVYREKSALLERGYANHSALVFVAAVARKRAQ